MEEFVVVFIVTTSLLCALAAAMYFGRPPIYHVSREEAVVTISKMLGGKLSEVRWLIFIGHAISTDPELNLIRLHCNDVEEAALVGKEIMYITGVKRYDQAGQDQLQLALHNLEKLIASTPVIKEF